MENFIGAKSWRNFLEGLKRKVVIFIGPKTYLTYNLRPFFLQSNIKFRTAGVRKTIIW